MSQRTIADSTENWRNVLDSMSGKCVYTFLLLLLLIE